MYPAKFDYLAPESMDEALAILAERGDEVKILAGGQSLIPMMKLRLARPSTLVDINRLPDLDSIDVQNGHLRVQALARHADVVRSDVVKSENALMASAAPWVADPIVRNLGTVCGSVAHHDPEGDWASVMLALDAEVVAVSKEGQAHFHPGADGERHTGGTRVIPINQFLVDMFTTFLHPSELVAEIRVPRYERGGGNYQKLERKIGDYATVGVAAHLELDGDDRIVKAGLALTSVYASNLKVREAEDLLVGESPSDELFAEAAQIARNACDPAGDVRGSADFKRHIVDVFTRRALAEALTIAQGGAS
ncbi:MAG TPA: xanthine dehydrogenase family protein subunit M [Acidimicrobiia bacterium]|nr:xanthine dehydrogenase family protein subunit M [Acidimicrobiia bacterium]